MTPPKKTELKKFLTYIILFSLCIILLLHLVSWGISSSMPSYRDSVGDINYTEKITGEYLVRQSAARDDNLIIFGSSELRTTDISTHPANFFSGKRSGFQVNLVGRGSCQSIIHAISVAASGDFLTGKKLVLITSPQSFVKDGIAPDLFMANFSPQQYLTLLEDDSLSDSVKQYISSRVLELHQSYEETSGTGELDRPISYIAQHSSAPNFGTTIRNAALSPYYSLSRYLYDLNDMTSSASLIKNVKDAPLSNKPVDINWEEEANIAADIAKTMTTNNDFGMLDEYYTTNIGNRLDRQKNKDIDLEYSVSKEYDDLRILFEVCRQKGIEPLFVHVPLHGQWSDYTGFSANRRNKYYENVREISKEYGIELLDLTQYEYEEYFLCDVMHLGWKGWLEVDKALVDYYYGL